MTRAVVFLTATLVAASLGLFAQDTSAASPSAVSSATPVAQVSAQNPPASSAAQGTDASTTPPNNKAAQNTPAAHTSTPAPTTESARGGIEGSASNVGSNNGQLPQTSTILPLLGLIGLGSLVAGLFARR
jgi:hypothetical protein